MFILKQQLMIQIAQFRQNMSQKSENVNVLMFTQMNESIFDGTETTVSLNDPVYTFLFLLQGASQINATFHRETVANQK